MSFGGDERAVSAVVGAVLLLGILVSALALYQVNVVPDQNHRTEFEHSEDVTADLIELRSAIYAADETRGSQSVPVTLGTRYQTRVAAINPPAPRGRLTTEPMNRSITVEGNGITNVDGLETSVLRYEPDYSEFRDAPTTVLESAMLYDEYDEEPISVEDQLLFGENSITIVALDGSLSRSHTGDVSVTVESLDGPVTERAGGDVTVTIPTRVPGLWTEMLDDHDRATVMDDGAEYVTVTYDGDDDTSVTVARVGIGDDASSGGLGDFGDDTTPHGPSGSEYEIGFDGQATEAANEGVDVSCESDGSACTISLEGSTSEFDLVTQTDDPVVGATVDYAVESDSIVEDFDRVDETDDAGESSTTLEVDIARGERESFSAYASSGGDGTRVALTVERGGGDVSLVGTPTTFGSDDDGVTFEIENRRPQSVTVDGISLDGTNSGAIRVNEDFGTEVTVEVDGTTAGSLDTGLLSPIPIDGTERILDEAATIEPDETARISISQFRERGINSRVDMRGHRLDLTLLYENGRSQPFVLDIGPTFEELSATTSGSRGGGIEATALEVGYRLSDDADGVDLGVTDETGTTVTARGDGGAGTSYDVELTGLRGDGQPSDNYPLAVTVAADPGHCFTTTVENDTHEPTVQGGDWDPCG